MKLGSPVRTRAPRDTAGRPRATSRSASTGRDTLLRVRFPLYFRDLCGGEIRAPGLTNAPDRWEIYVLGTFSTRRGMSAAGGRRARRRAGPSPSKRTRGLCASRLEQDECQRSRRPRHGLAGRQREQRSARGRQERPLAVEHRGRRDRCPQSQSADTLPVYECGILRRHHPRKLGRPVRDRPEPGNPRRRASSRPGHRVVPHLRPASAVLKVPEVRSVHSRHGGRWHRRVPPVRDLRRPHDQRWHAPAPGRRIHLLQRHHEQREPGDCRRIEHAARRRFFQRSPQFTDQQGRIAAGPPGAGQWQA